MVLLTFYSCGRQYKTLSQNNRMFIRKNTFKSHLKAILEDLHFKKIVVPQTWWVTLFRQIVS